MDNAIDITGVDLAAFAQEAYRLTAPAGVGVMLRMGLERLVPEHLDSKTARRMVRDGSDCPLVMRYVHGRACFMKVIREEGRLWIADRWKGHDDDKLKQLLAKFGIPGTRPEKRAAAVRLWCPECDRETYHDISGLPVAECSVCLEPHQMTDEEIKKSE